VAQVEHALSTSIVKHGASFANADDPVIPAKFAQLIVNIDGLDNIHASMPAGLERKGLPAAAVSHRSSTPIQLASIAAPGTAEASPDALQGGSHAFGPADMQKFYNEAPLLAGGNNGTTAGDCIALDEDSDFLGSAVTLFIDTTFNVQAANITTV